VGFSAGILRTNRLLQAKGFVLTFTDVTILWSATFHRCVCWTGAIGLGTAPALAGTGDIADNNVFGGK
jgi:hypothetical protein